MAQSKKRKSGKSGKKQNNRTAAKTGKKQGRKIADQRVLQEIWALILVATGAFLFVAVQFQVAGKAGNFLGNGLKGLFGITGYLIPWYIILCGIFLFLNKEKWIKVKAIVLTFMIMYMICLINSGRFIHENTAYNFAGFFRSGIALESGGAVGMSSAIFVVGLVGKAGLYIFSVLIVIACVLLLINTPISKGICTVRDKNTALAEKIRDRRNERELLPEAEETEEQLKIVAPFEEAEKKEKKDFRFDKAKRNARKKQLLDYMKDDTLFSKESEEPEASEPAEITGFGLEEQVTLHPGYGLGPSNDPVTPPEPEFAFVKASDLERAEVPKISKAEAAAVTLSEEEIAESEKITIKYKKPPIGLLNKPKKTNQGSINSDLKLKAATLEETLKSFNVNARVVQVTQGPAVTRYEIQPDVGVKVSSIVRLADDIALNLRAKSIRIEAPIPGKAAVGIEVENDRINMVTLREIIDSDEFRTAESKITFAVGKDIAGKAIVADLKGMPHLLIAGSTGSGKSVCINSIITSILYKANPDEVKLVLIDPKVVELGNYNGIPHLLIPVVTEPVKAAAALNWAVAEMTDRYKKFADSQVRDLESYNEAMRMNGDNDLVMPQIVIIIDELADLMMAAPSQVEESICRLAQMARAAGMHLIVATQRPSVDIITGVIKANIPSRIAFAVSSQFDSRTILDMSGAEKLVGKGDMLFNPLGMGKPVRVQGTFVSDGEVHSVIEHVKSQVQEVEYSGDVMNTIEKGNIQQKDQDDGDELLPDAIECVVRAGQASVSMLQRRFRIGYNRSARIVDMMEARGIVGPQDGSRPRQVLMTEEEFEEMKKEVEE